jgi:hypothetical protein
VLGSNGLRFLPDAAYEPGQADALVVAGGDWGRPSGRRIVGEVQRGGLVAVAGRRGRHGPDHGRGVYRAPCCWPTPASSGPAGPPRTTPLETTWSRPGAPRDERSRRPRRAAVSTVSICETALINPRDLSASESTVQSTSCSVGSFVPWGGRVPTFRRHWSRRSSSVTGRSTRTV